MVGVNRSVNDEENEIGEENLYDDEKVSDNNERPERPQILELVVIPPTPPPRPIRVRYIMERMSENAGWYALRTSLPRGIPTAKKFPTEYLSVNSKYWDAFKRLPIPHHGSSIKWYTNSSMFSARRILMSARSVEARVVPSVLFSMILHY